MFLIFNFFLTPSPPISCHNSLNKSKVGKKKKETRFIILQLKLKGRRESTADEMSIAEITLSL